VTAVPVIHGKFQLKIRSELLDPGFQGGLNSGLIWAKQVKAGSAFLLAFPTNPVRILASQARRGSEYNIIVITRQK
jgi:hypothetical protein